MKFATILALAAPMTLVNAASVAVKLYNDDQFRGGFYNVAVDTGRCNNIPKEYNDKATSIQIYPAGFRCRFYDNYGCTDSGFLAMCSGSNGNVGTYWNDRISAFQCFQDSAC